MAAVAMTLKGKNAESELEGHHNPNRKVYASRNDRKFDDCSSLDGGSD